MNITLIDQAAEITLLSHNLNQRNEAEAYLLQHLQGLPQEIIETCLGILTQTNSKFTQFYFTNSLVKMVNDAWNVLTNETKLKLLKFCSLNLELPNLDKLISLILRFGWFELDEIRQFPMELIGTTSQGGGIPQAQVHSLASTLHILIQITQDMSLPKRLSGQKTRKVAISFRDTTLLSIFSYSIKLLQDTTGRNTPPESLLLIISLLKTCLAFDFIGTNDDEADEPTGSIQIPGNWRQTISNPSLLHCLFSTYSHCKSGQLTSGIMEVLGMIASVRRSLFNEDERIPFLSLIMHGQCQIMQSNHGFNDESTFHEFAKSLTRMKMVYQLIEMIEIPCFVLWLENVAKLTLQSLSSQVAYNTIQYLLSFWSRMMVPSSQVKESILKQLELIASQIIENYVTSHIQGIHGFIEDLDMEQAHLLDPLANIARFNYSASIEILLRWWNILGGEYLQQGQPLEISNRLSSLQHTLAWFVILCGTFVGNRTPYHSSDDDDLMDGQVTCRIFSLKPPLVNDESSIALQLAILQYYAQFRKSYVGDQAQRASKVWIPLSENFGLSDPSTLLNFVLERVISNFNVWGKHAAIVNLSVKLLNEVSAGYTSVKIVRKLEPTTQLLFNHAQLPFLQQCNTLEEGRNRQMFYTSLSKLLFSGEDVDEIEFNKFVEPWSKLLSQAHQLTEEDLKMDRVGITLEGFFRDLRGFLNGITTKRYFNFVFNWLKPHFSMFVRLLRCCFDSKLAIAILRFYVELTQNKSQRLNFDVNSPNGVLLFREASGIVCAYGPVIYDKVPQNDKYSEKLKGISLCCHVIRWGLAGKYVNFGLMKLYQDRALENSLATLFKLFSGITIDDILQFPKVSSAYFGFWSVFSSEQLFELESLNPNVYHHLMLACARGIESFDNSIVSESSSIIDHITLHLLKNKSSFLWSCVQQHSQLLPHLMIRLISLVILEDSVNQWSLTRPLLSLMFLYPEEFSEYSSRLIEIQLVERRPLLQKCLHQLVENLDFQGSLTSKTRDVFSQNISSVRRSLTDEKLIELQLPPLK